MLRRLVAVQAVQDVLGTVPMHQRLQLLNHLERLAREQKDQEQLVFLAMWRLEQQKADKPHLSSDAEQQATR